MKGKKKKNQHYKGCTEQGWGNGEAYAHLIKTFPYLISTKYTQLNFVFKYMHSLTNRFLIYSLLIIFQMMFKQHCTDTYTQAQGSLVS